MTVINLIQDDTLQSETNGVKKYYWTDPGSWHLSAGAQSIRVYVDITTVDSNSRLIVNGQYSIDGRNWVDFASLLNPGTGLGAAGRTLFYYAGGPGGEEFGPFVRYGMSVEASSGSEQKNVRLTLSIVVHGIPSMASTAAGGSVRRTARQGFQPAVR